MNFWIVRVLPPVDEESRKWLISVLRRAEGREVPASALARLDQLEMDFPGNVDPSLREQGVPEWTEFTKLLSPEGLFLMAAPDVDAEEGDLTGKTWLVTVDWDRDGDVTDS